MVLLSHHGLIATHWSIARTFSSTAATAAAATADFAARRCCYCSLRTAMAPPLLQLLPVMQSPQRSAAAIAASANAHQRHFAEGTRQTFLLVLKLYSRCSCYQHTVTVCTLYVACKVTAVAKWSHIIRLLLHYCSWMHHVIHVYQ
eukprot:6590-Heterococcus_DN1.PRE.3